MTQGPEGSGREAQLSEGGTARARRAPVAEPENSGSRRPSHSRQHGIRWTIPASSNEGSSARVDMPGRPLPRLIVSMWAPLPSEEDLSAVCRLRKLDVRCISGAVINPELEKFSVECVLDLAVKEAGREANIRSATKRCCRRASPSNRLDGEADG